MNDPQRVSKVFVELADTLVMDFDVVEFLTTLAQRCVEFLHASEGGVMLADESGVLRSVASSSEAARLLELYEVQIQGGPCLDCVRAGVAIPNQSLTDGSNPWPHFSEEARRLGFSVVHALPMRLRGQVIGAVNVFSTENELLSDDDVAVGQALADVATVGLIQERSLRQARVLSEQLQAALTSRIVIEQAKGMLAERHGLEMDAAFDALRSHARSHNLRLAELASALLDGTLAPSTFDHL